MKPSMCGIALGVLLWSVPAFADADPFADFISPVSNPVNFEDPRSISDVRPIYIYHKISSEFFNPLLNGGDAHVVAVQARLAVNERFSIIATKDGYVWLNPKNEVPDVVEQKNGWANLAFGLKYAFYRDVENRAMGTVGLRYEAPTGDKDVLQGKVFKSEALGISKRGDGVLNPFLSGLWGVGDFHAMGYMGGRWAIDGLDSSFFDMSVHADYRFLNCLYPLLELNWVHVLDGGRRLQPVTDALGIAFREEGFDFFNLGSPQASGRDVVTLALGGRWRILDNLEFLGRKGGLDLGATYELPITTAEDLFGWRVTTDLQLWFM